MVEIPQKLKDFRFIVTKEKIPTETGWNTKNNHSYDEMQQILKKNTTYGILCGSTYNLLVIDVDKKEVNDELIQIEPFKSTFIVKTATKGLFHFYFISDCCESFKCFDKDMNTMLDVQGEGKQVIGPGSILSNGKKYEIYQDNEISTQPYEFLKHLLSKYDYYGLEQKPKEKKNGTVSDFIIEKIKQKYTVKDLLNKIGVVTRKNPTDCPFHESQGGKCLSYTDTLWHCFHCGKEGDLITLYQEYYKIDFLTAKKELMQLAGISDKQPEDVLKEYKELDVKKFVIYKSKDETQYKIFINDFFINLTPDTILGSGDFRKNFFNETGRLLKGISVQDWCDLVNQWMAEKGEMIDNTKDVNTDNIIVETILTEVQSFVIIKNPMDSASYGRLLYLDEEPNHLFLCNKVLEAIIKKNQFKINLNKLKILLDDYLEGKTKVIRTGKVLHRFFRFKRATLPDMDFNIDQINKTIELKEEDEDDS